MFGIFQKIISRQQPYIIDKDKIFNAIASEPRRICFNTQEQSNLFKRTSYGNVIAELKAGFLNSIGVILESETDQKFYEVKKKGTGTGKYKCYIRDEDTYEIIRKFYDKYNNYVFIRDSLFVSMALSMHKTKSGDNLERTSIGELEYNAKYNNCQLSIDEIVNRVSEFVHNTPYYRTADCICGVPSSKGLPSKIACKLSSHNNAITDISNNISFKNEKEEIKNKKDIDERWRILEGADLQVSIDVKEKRIILLDDMYQTGITMQYIAMKLIEAGASNVFGLSIVKSASNSL